MKQVVTGDVVCLRGDVRRTLKMTVTKRTAESPAMCTCTWVHGTEINEKIFPEKCLVIIPDPETVI